MRAVEKAPQSAERDCRGSAAFCRKGGCPAAEGLPTFANWRIRPQTWLPGRQGIALSRHTGGLGFTPFPGCPGTAAEEWTGARGTQLGYRAPRRLWGLA